MEVQIISKETIKPSSATPHNLRTFKLSILDQLSPPIYIPIILFYSPSSNKNFGKISDHLKKSFSQALTQFYPFAGRIKDQFVVDCNDDGAAFIEASVAGSITEVLQQADIDQLQQLLPCSPNKKSLERITDEVLLAVQVNGFSCGGLAISVCIWHAVADASTLATFVTSWAAITSGTSHNNVLDGEILDCTSLFPPQELSSFSLHSFMKEEDLPEIVMKRFSYDAVKIAALREEVGNIGEYSDCDDRPTRFEALSALILKAVIAATAENEASKINTTAIAVDLRRRLEPPPPQKSIGNIYQVVTVANWAESESSNNGLAGKIHESIKKMNNDSIRKLHAGGGYFNFIKKAMEMARVGPKVVVFGLSSWCNFPFYEADFGLGKPVWYTPAMKLNRTAVLLDSRDGEGIDAWIGLSPEDMVKFEQDPGIVTYACFSPRI